MYVSGHLSTSCYMRRVTHIFLSMGYTGMFKQERKGNVAVPAMLSLKLLLQTKQENNIDSLMDKGIAVTKITWFPSTII